MCFCSLCFRFVGLLSSVTTLSLFRVRNLGCPVVLGVPFCKTTIKASGTLQHQPTVWPVPYTFAQPYHPGSDSHGQLLVLLLPDGYPMLMRPTVIRPKQLSIAATALVISLCSRLRYRPDLGLVFECVTFIVFFCTFFGIFSLTIFIVSAILIECHTSSARRLSRTSWFSSSLKSQSIVNRIFVVYS